MTLSPEDRFAIQDLYAQYCHAIDANDGAAWADCFTEEGSFVPSIGPIAGQEYVGREALTALGGDAGREPATRHWNNSLLLDERDGHVSGLCYAVAIEVHGSEPEVVAHVVYRDELVKDAVGWRFRSRRPQADVEKKGSGSA